MQSKRVFGFLLVLLLALPAAAQRPDMPRDRFDVDWVHSSIGFSIDFMGLTKVEGRFTDYSGTILYDEKDLSKSLVAVVIKTKSIHTSNSFRDDHLRNPDFFDSEKYPYIRFESIRLEKRGPDYVLVGNLTMHGVTKEVSLPFRVLHGRMKDMWQNTRIGFLGTLKIDRREFGIVAPPRWESVLDAGRLTIGNEVEITLNIQGRIWNYERITTPKHVAAELLKTIDTAGVDAAIKQYRELKEKRAGDFEWGEGGLNRLGYTLLHRGKAKEAIEILKLNAEMFPASANAYDSLAEGYAAGDTVQAIRLYQKAQELDPVNPNPALMLRYLGAGSGR